MASSLLQFRQILLLGQDFIPAARQRQADFKRKQQLRGDGLGAAAGEVLFIEATSLASIGLRA